MPTARIPLSVHLHADPGALPDDGAALRVLPDIDARWSVSAQGACVHIVLPDGLAHAEQRWVVDRAIRRVRRAASIGAVTLHAAEGLDADLRLTLALDLVQTFGERVDASAAGVDADELGRVSTLVGGYRRWVNEDPAVRTSVAIAADVQAWARGRTDVQTEILAEQALRDEGCGLLLAVGGASVDSPPRLVLARYQPDGGRADEPPLLLCGKGITFDTGGINVKPYASFVSMMKNDMGGAALAYWLFRGLVEAGVPYPVALAIPTCENAIGEKAMRPGALVKGHRGLTVRVDHTDAEGRLALADALSLAGQRYQPAGVMTFATLTTAALRAYGPYATPVHFADAALERQLTAASAAMGEDLHFLPGRLWHREANRDAEADLRNTGRLPGHASIGAGSRNAGHFLRFFSDAPLVHLDIFASTWNWAGDAPGVDHGATGAPLRTLLRALETLTDAPI